MKNTAAAAVIAAVCLAAAVSCTRTYNLGPSESAQAPAATATRTQVPTPAATTAVHPSPDAYENDDTYQHASTLTPNGAAQQHSFDIYCDYDYVKFSLTAGQTYTIQTFNLGTGSDTYLYLFSTNGTTEISENDDYTVTASLITFTPAVSGVYYAAVRSYLCASRMNGTYSIKITNP